VQYADYAVWQRKWMEGEVLNEQAEYWRKNLEGAPELLEFACRSCASRAAGLRRRRAADNFE